MSGKLHDRWLGLPYPLWLLSACKPVALWCLIDDVVHAWFPMTYGFHSERVSHYPQAEPWCCRMHNRSVNRYWTRKEEAEA